MQKDCVSVVMPVYNEKSTVLLMKQKILSLDFVKELIIIDDGSTDGTRELLAEDQRDPKVKILLHDHNLGKGAAVNDGLKMAEGEIIAIQDADLEYNPDELDKLIAPVINGQAGAVYGSRFSAIKPEGMYYFNWLGNKLLTILTNILFGCNLTDMETGYKVFSKRALQGIKIESRDFSVEPEITAKVLRRGYKIMELPISYSGRGYGKGKKIKWAHGFSALWAILKYRFYG